MAELSDGFNGPLASKEGVFIALDSILMIIMSVLLTIVHPRFWFEDSRYGAVKYNGDVCNGSRGTGNSVRSYDYQLSNRENKLKTTRALIPGHRVYLDCQT